jgi:hypothetical protein
MWIPAIKALVCRYEEEQVREMYEGLVVERKSIRAIFG